MAISPWTCTRCGAVNASTATACVVCGQARESGAATPASSEEVPGTWTPPTVPVEPGSPAAPVESGSPAAPVEAGSPAAPVEPGSPAAPVEAEPRAGVDRPTDAQGPAAEWTAPGASHAGPGPGGEPITGAIPGWRPSSAPTPEAPPSTGSRLLGLLRPLGIVAVIAVVAIGAWWFSAKRDDSGAISDAGDLSSLELRVGDCFDLKDATAEYIDDVDARPCSETHEYEVFLVQDMPGGDFPSEATFDAYVADACLPAFATFVGLEYEQSELEIFYLVPSEDSWSEGDRAVMCAVYHPRIDELTGSLKGSAR